MYFYCIFYSNKKKKTNGIRLSLYDIMTITIHIQEISTNRQTKHFI